MLDASAIKKRFNSTPLAKVVSSIIVKNSRVFITFEINSPNEQSMLEEETRSILQDIPKDSVHFIFTNKDLNAPKPKLLINNVKNIILVSSGKGGVGKSTIALALAKKYKNAGYKVGILDADIYGPSIPRMLSIDQKPIIANGKFIPIESDGILVISAGLLVEKDVSMAWRGPMISKILYQMLSSTDWQDLDYLVVDMPPGTGDIHLSILENYKVEGVWIVTTPQKLSMDDVARAIELYVKFSIPIIGIIENMSDIFNGHAGLELSKRYGIQNLINIPYIKEISINADLGIEYEHLIELDSLL